MYRTMEGTHYNSPEKAIQVWRLFCYILFSRLVLTIIQEIFSLLLYLELSKIFSNISRIGDQRYSLCCCIWSFLKYFPLFLAQEIKDGKLGAFIWDSSRLEFEAAR